MNTKPKKTLNLTEDSAFRYFFSYNDAVLISFLKSFLPIHPNISDIEIMDFDKIKEEDDAWRREIQVNLEDSAILGDTAEEKETRLDLHAKLSSGERINIEMQTKPQKDFEQRVVGYWSRMYSHELRKGEGYGIPPVYSLVFTTFPVYKWKRHINALMFRADEPKYALSKVGGIVIVELSKVNKDYFKLVDLRDKRCYFLSHSNELTSAVRKDMLQTKELDMTLKYLDKVSHDDELFYRELSREKAAKDRFVIEKERREEGKAEGKAEVAVQMLEKGCASSLISEVTGLSETEIKRLNGKR